MWVDITDLINEVGVGEYVKITLLPSITDTGDYGIVDDGNSKVIDNIFCTMVENVDDVVDSQSGSYISRVTYDCYLPCDISLNNELEGATIETSDKRKFIITHKIINRRYVSHCVVSATEDKLTYSGGGI
ncbi:MAG: hypothetical protein ACRCX2_04985 [Paraclostridium sp.]